MRKTNRLVLSRERLRNLTPDRLGRVLGGEPGGESINDPCNSFDCNTLTLTNTFTNALTNTFTNTFPNTLTNTVTDPGNI
jgi:hypothetical protein